MTIHYFTFGPDHSHLGTPLRQRHVAVKARADHRAIFMGWLGSNEFSSEYDEREWAEYERQYPTTEYTRITVVYAVGAEGRLEQYADVRHAVESVEDYATGADGKVKRIIHVRCRSCGFSEYVWPGPGSTESRIQAAWSRHDDEVTT